MARGITCKAGQIFVTAGAQQAFSLIGQLFPDPGDRSGLKIPVPTQTRKHTNNDMLWPVDYETKQQRTDEPGVW